VRQAPLNKLAFWRVGGPAELLVEVSDLGSLQAVMALAPPQVTVLGNGSNALIHDDGIPGVVLQLSGALSRLTPLEGHRVRVGGGMRLVALLARLDRMGLTGAGAFAGIPGTAGGAVVMNAGSRMGETGQLVESVTVVLPGGEVQVLPHEALDFSYRHARLPKGAVVAEVILRLSDREVEERLTERRAFLARRKATQPLNLPSCGSTFTNPRGDYAGRLIEAAGLKGRRHGGAQISEKHANFIVNLGDATAEDIRWLIAFARCEVRERFGVWLHPEVKLLGAWARDALDRL
jgi:UDP-N-acetylmuramate dehydrogenase